MGTETFRPLEKKNIKQRNNFACVTECHTLFKNQVFKFNLNNLYLSSKLLKVIQLKKKEM